jgi:hypothetical protein
VEKMSRNGRGAPPVPQMKEAPPDRRGLRVRINNASVSAVRPAMLTALTTLTLAALTRLLTRLGLTPALLLLAWLLATATLLLTRAWIVLLLLVGIWLVGIWSVRIVHD